MVLEALQKHRAAKKIPPLEKIGVCLEFFHELAKMPKCHLKVNKCDIYETDTFSQYIRSKNLTVEELHVDSFDMKNFADIRYQSAVKQLGYVFISLLVSVFFSARISRRLKRFLWIRVA